MLNQYRVPVQPTVMRYPSIQIPDTNSFMRFVKNGVGRYEIQLVRLNPNGTENVESVHQVEVIVNNFTFFTFSF